MSGYFCGFRQLVMIKSLRATNSWKSKPPWEETAIFHFTAIINGDEFQAGPLWRSLSFNFGSLRLSGLIIERNSKILKVSENKKLLRNQWMKTSVLSP